MNLSKNLGTMKRVSSAKLFNKKYPISITHIITTKCNKRCVYCDMWKHDEEEMTTEQIFSMLDEFSKLGLRRYGISGGEPLLRNDIGEIIDYAKSKGIIVTLFTNGVLLKEKINQIKNIDALLISFDGTEEIHDLHRQRGAYQTTIEAIKIARENNIPVWAGLTLTKHNLNSIDFVLEKAKELDFKVLIQPVYFYPGYSSNEKIIRELFGDEESYKKAIQRIISLKKNKYPVMNSFTYFKSMLNPYKANKKCLASKLFCAITPGGRVSPCFKIYNQEKWPSGVELGFKKAFLSIPKQFSCCGCFSYATTEPNLFYSFKPEVMYNTFKNFF